MENKSYIGVNPVGYISNWINSIKDQPIKNQGRAINRMYDELASLTMVDRPDVSKAYEILKEYCQSVEGLYKAMNDDELINGKYEQEESFKNIGNISIVKEFDKKEFEETVYPMPDPNPMQEPILDPPPMDIEDLSLEELEELETKLEEEIESGNFDVEISDNEDDNELE